CPVAERPAASRDLAGHETRPGGRPASRGAAPSIRYASASSPERGAMNTFRLVLLRHGQSQWNLENRFTGWTDVDLTPAGVAEARRAARLLAEARLSFDIAFTSVLKRAIRTLWIVQDDLDLMWIPTRLSWRLNERHYGALQGLNKAETAARYGD